MSWDSETTSGWRDLIRHVGVDPAEVSHYQSWISRVLPANSPQEEIFAVTGDDGVAAPDLVVGLGRHILQGAVDVTVCYCSVYEECWISNLQDVIQRTQGVASGKAERQVDDCRAAPRSRI